VKPTLAGTLAALAALWLSPDGATATPAVAKPPAKTAATKPAAKPGPRTRKTAAAAIAAKPAGHPGAAAAALTPKHDGAHARVAINHAGDLRPAREVVGRREEPLTAEEATARQIEKLLRGPLRYSTTGLFVADARTGEALFAVNADDPLNPASNVKMISTAAALELLGADFKYPTRLLGATPADGVVHGDVYLLGSYDPTLILTDLDQLATAVAARGITRIDGGLVVGTDPTRDGLYRASVPIAVRAGAPGAPAIAAPPAGMDLVTIKMEAKTARTAARPRLTYQVDTPRDPGGPPRVVVTIGGTIGKGGATTYNLPLRDRTAMAAYALRAALRAHGVALAGDVRTAELDRYVTDATAAGNLPVELGRHESARLAEIVAHVNKWSINWLADGVIMTAAALARQQPPSMELALSAMYDWLGRHPRITKDDLVVDTGSGLSYHTRITTHELVSIVRSASGFAADANTDAALSRAWLDSLSIAGTDGTLSSRFRAGDVRGRIHAKTGTLSTVIALSGVLDVDPDRPLAFSLVTNGDAPLSPRYIRRAHEQVVGLLVRYLRSTQKPGKLPATSTAPAATSTAPTASSPSPTTTSPTATSPAATSPAAPPAPPAPAPPAAVSPPALPPGDVDHNELDDGEPGAPLDTDGSEPGAPPY
jgi:D-alanyl-D-alanine carboxypeptidase/D-alanyl-D-alanine-endopeptidase (penicillin-binding protein 4)